MKKILLILLLGTLSLASELPRGAFTGYELNRMNALARKHNLGTHIVNAGQWGTRGQWSFLDQGGLANQDLYLHDYDGQKIVIPNGTIIYNCWIDVAIPPKSATSSGTLAFWASDLGDIKSTTAVGGYTQGSLIACNKPTGTGSSANMIRMGSDGALLVRTGSEALTQGKINVWIEYLLSAGT